jgi:hypothetical protein
MIVIAISTTWVATLLLVAAVCKMAAYGEHTASPATGRSPRLLDMTAAGTRTFNLKLEDRRRSKTAAAEHVGNGAQEDLYVRP